MDLLDKLEYDFIVLGTGLEESLLASAVAKAGKTVLHLDPAAHYGTHWAGLRLDQFLEWAHHLQATGQAPVAEAAHLPPVPLDAETSQQEWIEVAVRSAGAESGPTGLYHSIEVWSAPCADLGAVRSYSIDLAPKVALCAGPLVEALLQSGAHNYVEFKLLQGSYIWREGRLQPVPASKGDVFRSRSLSPSDKRILMRFLKACSDAMEGQGHLKDSFGMQPFVELLKSEGLSEQLQNVVLYAIALCGDDQHAAVTGLPASRSSQASAQSATTHAQSASDDAMLNDQQLPRQQEATQSDAVRSAVAMTAAEGWGALQLYMASAGKYSAGGSAFMALEYGVGELSQAFCRVAAVAGATYVLRHPVSALLVDPNTKSCVGVRTSAGQILRCEALAADAVSLAGLEHLPAIQQSSSARGERAGCSIARAVCITDGPLQDEESQLLLVIPPGAVAGIHTVVRVLQVGAATSSAPEGRYLLYISTPATPNVSAAKTLSAVVDALVQIPPEWQGPAAESDDPAVPSFEEEALDPSPSTGTTSAELHPLELVRGEGTGRESTLMDVRPKALMVVYYLQDCITVPEVNLPPNVAGSSPPDVTLGFATVLAAASTSFQRLFPFSDPYFLGVGTRGKYRDEGSDDDTVEQLQTALAGAVLPAR